MLQKMCRRCADDRMKKRKPQAIEGTETVGQCPLCMFISPEEKPLMLYELDPKKKKIGFKPPPVQTKDTHARYREPWRVDF